MAVHITIPVPHIPIPRSRRAAILGAVAALGVGAVLVAQLIESEGGPSEPAASVEASGHQFLDPVERAFITGAGQTAAVAPMLDPVELEFITGSRVAATAAPAPMLDPIELGFITGVGSDAPVHGCYSVGPC